MKINWEKITEKAEQKYGSGAIKKLCQAAGITTSYFYASKKRDTISFDKLFTIANKLDIHPGELLISQKNERQQTTLKEPPIKYEKTINQNITDGQVIQEIYKEISHLKEMLNDLINRQNKP